MSTLKASRPAPKPAAISSESICSRNMATTRNGATLTNSSFLLWFPAVRQLEECSRSHFCSGFDGEGKWQIALMMEDIDEDDEYWDHLGSSKKAMSSCLRL